MNLALWNNSDNWNMIHKPVASFCWLCRLKWTQFFITLLSRVKSFSSPLNLGWFWPTEGFPHTSVGKESICKAGEPGLIPGLGRSLGEGIGYPLQYSWASLSVGKEFACNVRDLGLMPRLGRSPGEGIGYPLQYSGVENSMDCIVHGLAKSWTWSINFHFHFDQWNEYDIAEFQGQALRDLVLSILALLEGFCHMNKLSELPRE